MRPYLALIKVYCLEGLVYTFSVFFTLIGNLLYVVLLFFLWKGIYGTSEIIHGMTFNEVFVYLTLASSIVILFHTDSGWGMSTVIRTGEIIIYMLRPVSFRVQLLCFSLGRTFLNLLLITIPSLVVILIVFRGSIPIGLNIIVFPTSVACAFVLSFMLDYLVGLTGFYTESIWGINTAKDVIVSLLSGALIPLPFFPENIQHILQLLPFQAIYYIPLRILTGAGLQWLDYVQFVGIQLFWLLVFIIVSGLFEQRAFRVLTVNGG